MIGQGDALRVGSAGEHLNPKGELNFVERGPIVQVDYVEARRFLSALAPNALSFTFQMFDDTEKKRPGLARVRHGSLDDALPELARLSRDGAGLFVTVNETDGRGRSKENVVGVRAVFIDLDGAPLDPVLPYEPHVVVDSSAGRFHPYWLVAPGFPLGFFEPVQVALASKFGGDSSVRDLSRVMRLPGSVHQKKAPCRVRIRSFRDSPPLTFEEVVERFGIDIGSRKKRTASQSRETTNGAAGHGEECHSTTGEPKVVDNVERYCAAAFANEISLVRAATEGTRNNQLSLSSFALGRLVGAGHLDRPRCEAELVSGAIDSGLGEREARDTIHRGLEKGMQNPRRLTERARRFDDRHQDQEAAVTQTILIANYPMRFAEEFLETQKDDKGRLTLRFYAGGWWRYSSGEYVELGNKTLENELWRFVDQCWIPKPEGPLVRAKATKVLISNILEALAAFDNTTIPTSTTPPVWLGDRAENPLSGELAVIENGIFTLDDEVLVPATPEIFATSRIRACWHGRSHVRHPHWTAFLESVFGTDLQSIDLLQEWFGYLISAETSLQKMMLMVGPRRSGKGTIARVLSALLGRENVAAPTLASLTERFGLSPLLGKPLAIIGDARSSVRIDKAPMIERLLSITGEDSLTIDRKHREPVTMRLPTRIMILSNELPSLQDASGALPSRMLVLQMPKSFYGKEDTKLEEKLRGELDGIFAWAVDGWMRLRRNGVFTGPESSKDLLSDLDELSAPISVFAEEELEFQPNDHQGEPYTVEKEAVFDRWQTFCLNRRLESYSLPEFSKMLKACFPEIRDRRSGNGKKGKRSPRKYSGVRLYWNSPGRSV